MDDPNQYLHLSGILKSYEPFTWTPPKECPAALQSAVQEHIQEINAAPKGGLSSYMLTYFALAFGCNVPVCQALAARMGFQHSLKLEYNLESIDFEVKIFTPENLYILLEQWVMYYHKHPVCANLFFTMGKIDEPEPELWRWGNTHGYADLDDVPEILTFIHRTTPTRDQLKMLLDQLKTQKVATNHK